MTDYIFSFTTNLKIINQIKILLSTHAYIIHFISIYFIKEIFSCKYNLYIYNHLYVTFSKRTYFQIIITFFVNYHTLSINQEKVREFLYRYYREIEKD